MLFIERVTAVYSRVVVRTAGAAVCACSSWLFCSPVDTALFNYKISARSDLTSSVVSFIPVRC